MPHISESFRCRVQLAIHGYRGHKDDTLYAARRTLHTGADLRLEHLRGSALGFRNFTHYIAGSLLETGGFRPLLHPGL
ncbi:hypothetical protein SRABI83_04596 [Arthrobacter sp. Bi83]|nr:hypothetical protein SRABI83_04596 [Arthrobacter sp. Bi83]